MSDQDIKGDKRRTTSDPAANDDAIQEGLVTDEGVNEDRTGAHGPTLEEGEQDRQRGKPGIQR